MNRGQDPGQPLSCSVGLYAVSLKPSAYGRSSIRPLFFEVVLNVQSGAFVTQLNL